MSRTSTMQLSEGVNHTGFYHPSPSATARSGIGAEDNKTGSSRLSKARFGVNQPSQPARSDFDAVGSNNMSSTEVATSVVLSVQPVTSHHALSLPPAVQLVTPLHALLVPSVAQPATPLLAVSVQPDVQPATSLYALAQHFAY